MYTEAGNKAAQKYVRKTYDSVMFRVKKGEREKLQQVAALQGESVNLFLKKAVRQRIDNLGLDSDLFFDD